MLFSDLYRPISPITQRPPAARVRYACPADKAAIRAVNASCAQPCPESELESALEMPFVQTWVALRGSRVCGFLQYSIPRRERFLVLERLAVHRDFRRIGIGRELMATARNAVIRNERDRLRITVRERDLDAQLFLRACCIRATGLLHGYFKAPDEDGVRFVYPQPAPEPPIDDIGHCNCPESCP